MYTSMCTYLVFFVFFYSGEAEFVPSDEMIGKVQHS